MTTDILRHSEPTKWVKNLYCVAKASESELALRRSRLLFFLVSWISFTKTSRSFHYVSTHFYFFNFGTTFTSFTSATSRKTIHRIVFLGRVQIRSFQGLINEKIPKKDISLRSIWRYLLRHSEPTKWVKNLYYSNLAYIYSFWYFWQQKYRKTARLQLRDLFW